MKKIKDLLIEKLADLYGWFFKTKKTAEIKTFIESIFFVFIATGIAKGLWFIVNILSGRLMGESLYGEYTLIVSISAFLAIPLGFGILGGITKNLAETEKFIERKKIISTSANYVMFTTFLFSAIYLLFYRQLAAFSKIGPNLFILTIILIMFMSANTLFDTILKGLHKQKKWSLFYILAYVPAFILFSTFVLLDKIDIFLIYLPQLLTLLIFSGAGFIYLRKYFSFKILDKVYFKKLFHFGFYSFIVATAGAFLGNVDIVMINYFMGADSVGSYQAYFMSSIMLIGVLQGVFMAVFFPTAVKLKNPKMLLKKMDRVMKFVSPVLLISVPFIVYIGLYLYNYPFSLLTAVLFGIATMVDILAAVYSGLLNAQGVFAIKKTALGLTLAFLINIPINYVLIQKIGINGAIIGTTISFLLLFLYLRISLGRITSEKPRKSD